MRHYLNDGSADEPKLRVCLSLDNLADLRPDTLWPELEGDDAWPACARTALMACKSPAANRRLGCLSVDLETTALPTSNYANSPETGFEGIAPVLSASGAHRCPAPSTVIAPPPARFRSGH